MAQTNSKKIPINRIGIRKALADINKHHNRVNSDIIESKTRTNEQAAGRTIDSNEEKSLHHSVSDMDKILNEQFSVYGDSMTDKA